MPADETADQLGIAVPEHRDYETVAGRVIGQIQQLPNTGAVVEVHGWRFEVVDLDGRRIEGAGHAYRHPDRGGLNIVSLQLHSRTGEHDAHQNKALPAR